MSRTAVWLILVLLTSLASAQPPPVVLSGDPTDVAGLEALHKDAVDALAELTASPLPDAAANKARTELLTAERDTLQATLDLVRAIGTAPKDTTDLEGELETARQKLTTVRNAGRENPKLDEITQEEVEAAESAVSAADGNRDEALAVAKAAVERIKKRTTGFDSLAKSITSAMEAVGKLTKDLEAATDQRKKDDLVRSRRTAELQLRILELTRAHHPTLLKRDKADEALLRLLAEIASEEAKNASAYATTASKARATELDAEQARKRKEAARKAEEAKNASPARSAVLTLESLVSAFEGAESGELSRKQRVTQLVRKAISGLERVQWRNKVIERLFPAGAELDGWKVQALQDETRRLEAAQRVLETSVQGPAIALATESREWFRTRDRLEEFANLIDQIRNPILDDEESSEGYQLRGVDEEQDRYLEAVRTFAAPDTAYRDLFKDEYTGAETRLYEVAEKRIKHLELLDAEASKLFAIRDDLKTALDWRRRYLASISLWLKSPPPFSAPEREGAFEEIGDVGDAIADAPTGVADAWSRWSDTHVGAVWLPTLLAAWIAISLLGGPIIGRRMRSTALLEKPREELDPLTSTLKIVLTLVGRTFPSLLMLVGAAWLAWIQIPGDPAAAISLAATGIWWLWRASGVLAEVTLGREGHPGLVRCEEETSRRARRVALLLTRGVAVLFPTGHLLDSLGHHRFAAWFYVALGVWSVLVSAWLIVRRDALLLLIPTEGGLLARTFRTLLPYVWPIAVAFYGGVVILAIRGYRHAAWHYGSRFLLCAAVLVAGAIVFQILAALLRRRLGPRNEQEESALENPATERATTRLVAFRILTSLTFVAVAAVSVFAFSTIFSLEAADWAAVANYEWLNLDEENPLRLGDVAQALFVLVAGLAIARWTRDAIRVVMASRMQRGSRYVVRTLVYYSLVAITIVMAFGALGLNLDQLGWFFAAAGVGIGFGLQEVISNFIAGLILFFERPVQVGDIISVGSVEGDVTRINIRSTEVRTRDGISIIIPNKRFITDDVINWSHGDQRTRLHATVGVAYGSDVELVKKVLIEVGTSEKRALRFPPPEVNFREFGESELSFELMLWLKSPDPTLRRHVTTDVNTAIDAIFREHGIQIPFPQRDIHVKSRDAELGA